MKVSTSDLKKDTIFHIFHDIAQFLLSVFQLATSGNGGGGGGGGGV